MRLFSFLVGGLLAQMLAQPRWRGLLAILVGVLVRLRAEGEPDRRAGHVEILAQPVDQIAFVAFGQLLGEGAHGHECGRAGLDLRHVADLDPAAARRGGRVRIDHCRQPLVQARGRHPAVPHLMGAQDCLAQPFKPAPGAGRHGDQRGATQLRQQARELFLQLGELLLLVVLDIPLVDGDDDGAEEEHR